MTSTAIPVAVHYCTYSELLWSYQPVSYLRIRPATTVYILTSDIRSQAGRRILQIYRYLEEDGGSGQPDGHLHLLGTRGAQVLLYCEYQRMLQDRDYSVDIRYFLIYEAKKDRMD